jgi:hypothetical protein
LDAVQPRLRYRVKLLSEGKHTVFARKCGIPPGSFQAYIDGERVPPTEHLIKIVTVYGIKLNWLLVGEDEPFIEQKTQGEESAERGKVVSVDPVVRLLDEEGERAGITLTPGQRIAILKILREFVDRDLRSIRELLLSLEKEPNQVVEPK